MSKTICKVEDCESFVVGQGLCRKHYMRVKRNGTLDIIRKYGRNTCTEEGCESFVEAHGLCVKHDYRSKPHPKVSHPGRICEWCDGPIEETKKSSAMFCSVVCKRNSLNLKSMGITLKIFKNKLKEQNGECGICGSPELGRSLSNRFAIDHDHSCCPDIKSCGKCFRGLLCASCNSAVGLFGDDPEIFQAAINYLADPPAYRFRDA